MRNLALLIISLFMCLNVMAQKERKFVREGNNLFHKNDFEKSEVEYRKALNKKEKSYEARFNLGDALFKQKKFDEALNVFVDLSKTERDKNKLGEIFHNIGNTYLSQKKLDEAIEAYKQSLRNNPTSKETKYNLEWARQQKQQNKDNKQDKDKQNKDKQNKDKQDKDKQDNQQGEKDKQDKDKQDKKDKKDKQDNQQGEKNKISKDDAKRLLEALQNDEKKVQEKVKKAKAKALKAKKKKVTKDW